MSLLFILTTVLLFFAFHKIPQSPRCWLANTVCLFRNVLKIKYFYFLQATKGMIYNDFFLEIELYKNFKGAEYTFAVI